MYYVLSLAWPLELIQPLPLQPKPKPNPKPRRKRKRKPVRNPVPIADSEPKPNLTLALTKGTLGCDSQQQSPLRNERTPSENIRVTRLRANCVLVGHCASLLLHGAFWGMGGCRVTGSFVREAPSPEMGT